MNQTEAWEIVMKAAELFNHQVPGACLRALDGTAGKLEVALRKTKPRVVRMRQRLEDIRQRRKKVTKGPKWLREL